ncbi:insulinase family protein [Candidatus Saccharibacteria bacterium]|nr:insulinase family protein [Candidatus Saccharibacteria bacterium]
MEHTVREVELTSGARGLLIDVPGATVMNFKFYFRAGNAFTKSHDVYEVAHLMEHMAFGANAKYADTHAFEDEFTKNGAYHNAYTSDYFICYLAECADFEWKRILELQLLSVASPKFNEEEFDSERGNIRNELVGYQNDYGRLIWPSLQRAVGEDVLLLDERVGTLDKIRLEDVREHYGRTHTARNMRFVISGNLRGREAEIRKMLEEMPLLEGEELAFSEVEYRRSEPVMIRRADATNLSFGIAMLLPRRLTLAETDAMSAVNHLLTGTLSSRILGQARKKGLTYGVFSDLQIGQSNCSWDFGGDANYETADELFGVMERELAAVADGAVDGADVELVQNYFLGRHQMNMQTVGRVGDFYAERFANYGEVALASEVPERIAGLSGEMMVGVVREIMKSDLSAMVAVANGDEKQVKRLGEILPALAREAKGEK